MRKQIRAYFARDYYDHARLPELLWRIVAGAIIYGLIRLCQVLL